MQSELSKITTITNRPLIQGKKLLNFQIGDEMIKNPKHQSSKLNDEEMNLVKEPDITNCIENFLFKADQVPQNTSFIPTTIIPDKTINNQILIKLFTKEEVFLRIKNCASKNSPGNGEILKEFYAKFWPVIKEDLVQVINDLLAKRQCTKHDVVCN
jgi:hypothetical protein